MLADYRIDDHTDERAVSEGAAEAIVIGLVLSCCLVMLSHSFTYLSNIAELSVEAGVGMQAQQRFEGDVNAAPWNKKVGFLGYAAVGAYCFLTSLGRARLKLSVTCVCFATYIALIFASISWSTLPSETARELVRVAVYLFVAASIARKFTPRNVVLVLFVMAFGSVMTACVASFVTGNFQPWRSNFRLHGTIHSNALAGLGLVALLASATLAGLGKRRALWTTLAVSMLSVVVLTKTRGVLAASLFGLMSLYLIRRTLVSNLLLISSGVIVLCVLMGTFVLGGTALQHTMEESLELGRSEGVSSLTGRLPLWRTLWKESQGHRGIGFGYGAFWTTDRIQSLFLQLEWYPGHSHSAYVHTLLDLGFVGVTSVACLVVSALLRCKRLLAMGGDPAYQFFFALLCAGIVHGFSEVEFVYPRALGIFLAVAFFSIVYDRAPAAETVDSREAVDGSSCGTESTLPWSSPSPIFT